MKVHINIKKIAMWMMSALICLYLVFGNDIGISYASGNSQSKSISDGDVSDGDVSDGDVSDGDVSGGDAGQNIILPTVSEFTVSNAEEKIIGQERYYCCKTIPQITYVIKSDKSWKVRGYQVFLNGTIIKEEKFRVTNSTSSKKIVLSSDVLSDIKPGKNEITISLKSVNGSIVQNADTRIIYFDDHKPEIAKFEIKSKYGMEINQLVQGNFYNGAITISVHGMDDYTDKNGHQIEGSGIRSVVLYANGRKIAEKDADNGIAKFNLPEEIVVGKKYYSFSNIKAYVVDWAGNKSSMIALNANDMQIKNDCLIIESTMPEAEFFLKDGVICENSGKKYFKDDFSLLIKLRDEESGLKNTEVTVENSNVLFQKNYNLDDSAELCKYDQAVVKTTDIMCSDLDVYEFVVGVCDNCGNKLTKSEKYYKDLTAPQITEYKMISRDSTKFERENFSIIETDYGYYFKSDVLVNIYASDGIDDGCGVKEIEYYTIDNLGKMSDKKTKTVQKDSDGREYIEVVLDKGFKGQIYACAVDNLGNRDIQYVSPKGVIIDTPERHAVQEHIRLLKPDSAVKDRDGNDLYPNDINVEVFVSDKMSGIKSIDWDIDAEDDTYAHVSHHLDISEDGEIVSDDSGWKKTATDKNLVTEMSKTILVSGNSNNIKLTVKMTDRAGNETQKELIISIDKTAPVIKVTFDNADSDPEYKEFYNCDRTATISVSERNFNENGISVEITNTDGIIPDISGWSTEIDAENPGNFVSTATVVFSADGEYMMQVSGIDAVQNSAESVGIEKFIIDKTVPQIDVKYSTNDALNGNYYAETRIAHISITEHNFAPERVIIDGTVISGTKSEILRGGGVWVDTGDIHTISVPCSEDGLYSFEVKYSDKAGNNGEKYDSEPYYIDQTAPEIEILGVENFSANNGQVIPEVIITDGNYDNENVNILLQGVNSGVSEPNGKFINIQNGQIFMFNDFPYEAQYDDMYTVEVTVKDLAGNETRDAITFSVNRFGSVYIFDESLKQISGTYINREIDVKLTEINVDNLEHDSIKVIVDANGTVRKLEEGEDYSVEQYTADGTWCRYDYDIYNSVFAGDGRYIVTLYSQDKAGNVNENVDESKKAEISFGVDKTRPVIMPIDIESDTQYSVDVKTAKVLVNDNLVLKDVDIYVDSVKCEYTQNDELFFWEVQEDDRPHTIKVVAYDLAGNTAEYIIDNVLVTTNVFVRWYNNKPLVVGTIAAPGLFCGVAGMVTYRLKRKKMWK